MEHFQKTYAWIDVTLFCSFKSLLCKTKECDVYPGGNLFTPVSDCSELQLLLGFCSPINTKISFQQL